MKEINIVSLQMIKTDTLNYLKNRILNPEDAAEIMRSFIGNSDREHLILICMNSKNKPTHIQMLSIGSINQTVIYLREIFKTALLSNANSIIIGHNNLSGDATPSPEDINVTERLMPISEIMGILFYEHIIFSDSQTYSIRQHDLKVEI
ncbi:JAB domain-containing protein [Staphylococcus xylosus]|uniref:JAB domain-containing protein n=1 Tax=Staphylococcus xylosus TaxID=1288 RepID=UPI002DBAA50E|nr:JAB domain-containing protein [Staphylococcus xylosus]MEB7822013.1 JAB domain-containing protein [Staphylococcus xylosus]MEB8187600.1 JAB domain-containing protein [Staphylococcus xylosus]